MPSKRLAEYKDNLSKPLRQATLCFLVKDEKVLLGMKKRGFGEGKWNGFGGKLQEGEDIYESAARELKEEVGIDLVNFVDVARIDFYGDGFGQSVTVLLVNSWDGEPIESEEMRPQWFNVNKLPLKDMWIDDELWLPQILSGESLDAEFLFANENKILEYTINPRS